MSDETDSPRNASQARHLVTRALAQAVSLPLVVGSFLFVPAGMLAWTMAWAVLVIFVAGTLDISLLAALKKPDLAVERLKPADGAKDWDRILTSATNLLPISGLDNRFAWSPNVPRITSLIALLMFAFGYAIVGWAMTVNPFFSAIVRTQT